MAPTDSNRPLDEDGLEKDAEKKFLNDLARKGLLKPLAPSWLLAVLFFAVAVIWFWFRISK